MADPEKHIEDHKEQDLNKPARVVLVVEDCRKRREAHEEELGKLKGVDRIIMTENSTGAFKALKEGAGITHVMLSTLSPFGWTWLEVAEAAKTIGIEKEKIIIMCFDNHIQVGKGYVSIPRRNIGDAKGQTSYKKLLGL